MKTKASRYYLGDDVGFCEFWKNGIKYLGRNTLLISPILALLLVYSLGSATLLYIFEQKENPSVDTWWSAFYLTLITMTTIGNPEPHSVVGMLLTPLDGLMGLIIFGVVVWIVTVSLHPKRR